MAVRFYLSLIIILLLVSCGGGTDPYSLPTHTQQTEVAAGSIATDLVVVPVRMQPQTPIQPGFKTPSFVQAAELIQALPFRQTSTTTEILNVNAGEYAKQLVNNKVSAIGELAEFQPAVNASNSPIEDYSYAVFDLTMDNFNGEETISLNWNAGHEPDSGNVWLGLSDWQHERWVWYAGPEDDVVSAPIATEYTSAESRLLVLLLLGGTNRCLLETLSLGLPEERGTGGLGDDDLPPTDHPPLYIPPLPGNVDLAPQCAPIADQGTWGSCTAFAVGNSAYNHELGKIYGGLGWNLNDAAHRVSPDYLYVVSGEIGGFPPSGEYGRYTDEVAEVLRTEGCATELNAPYDLVYDNNWSTEALQEAALLNITNWWEIPCHSPAGIHSIKAVLALQERPVFFHTYLDYQFLYYTSGEIWNYSGPPVGAHAMCIVGYDDSKQAFKVRNSWSADWGEAGYVWIYYNSVQNPYAYTRCFMLWDDYDSQVATWFLGTTSELSPPVDLSASEGTSAGSIDLEWHPVDSPDGYRIYRDTATNLIDTVGAVSTYSDTSVTDQLSHVYWVTGTQGVLESYLSSPAIGYLAQPPTIVSVNPSGGSVGEEVIFQAVVYGSNPLAYAWDFGTAATPSTSIEATPTVVLGAEGTYQCTLEVTNTQGSDTYDFEVSVGPNLPPIIYLDVELDSNATPANAIFDASSSNDPDGEIVLYSWRLTYDGDVTWEGDTTVPQVTRTLVGAGNHQMNLMITDNSGNTASKWETVNLNPENILPTPNFYWFTPTEINVPIHVDFYSDSLDSDGEITSYAWDFDNDGTFEIAGPDENVASHAFNSYGRFPVTHQVTDDDGAVNQITKYVEVGLAMIQPGWQAYAVAEYTPNNSSYLNQAIINGKPAFILVEWGEGDTFYFSATVDEPASQADWVPETLFTASNRRLYSLSDLGGTPVFIEVEYDGSHYSLVFHQHNGGWVTHPIEVLADGSLKQAALSLVNGKPGIVYEKKWTTADDGLWYARSLVAQPTGASDWFLSKVMDDEDTGEAVLFRSVSKPLAVDSKPQVVINRKVGDWAYEVGLLRASVNEPLGIGDWQWYDFLNEQRDFLSDSVMVLGGTVAVCYYTSEIQMARAKNTAPVGSGDWEFQTIEPDDNATLGRLFTVNGYPYVTSNGNSYNHLAAATTTDPQDIYDWQRSTPLKDDNYQLYPIEVNGQPAFIVMSQYFDIVYYMYPSP